MRYWGKISKHRVVLTKKDITIPIINLEHIIKYFLYTILIIFILSFVLLYSSVGNNLLTPYASSFLSKKLNNKIQVTVTDMSLSLPYFKLHIMLNDKTKVTTKGTLNPFTQAFKLNYKLITPDITCKDKAMGRDFYLVGEANGTMKMVKFDGEGRIFSSLNKAPLAIIKLKNGTINKSLKTVNCDYKFNVDNLTKMTRSRYQGNIEILGKILYHKGLEIIGGTENLDGYANFRYKDDKTLIKLTSLSAEKLLYFLNYPAAIDAKINGDIDYYLADDIASIDLALKNINFTNCITTQNLYKVLKIDMKKNSFAYGKFKASLNKEHLTCDFKIQNKNSHLYLTNTYINQNKKTIKSLFDIKMQNQKISGKLYGPLYEPNIKINMGALLAFKVKQMINPANSFDMKSKLDCIKGVADGLFGDFF